MMPALDFLHQPRPHHPHQQQQHPHAHDQHQHQHQQQPSPFQRESSLGGFDDDDDDLSALMMGPDLSAVDEDDGVAAFGLQHHPHQQQPRHQHANSNSNAEDDDDLDFLLSASATAPTARDLEEIEFGVAIDSGGSRSPKPQLQPHPTMEQHVEHVQRRYQHHPQMYLHKATPQQQQQQQQQLQPHPQQQQNAAQSNGNNNNNNNSHNNASSDSLAPAAKRPALTTPQPNAAALLLLRQQLLLKNLQQQRQALANGATTAATAAAPPQGAPMNPFLVQQLLQRQQQQLLQAAALRKAAAAQAQQKSNNNKSNTNAQQSQKLQASSNNRTPKQQQQRQQGQQQQKPKVESEEERRRRKRTQQLIRNREAADRSRMKKKQELERLKAKVSEQADTIGMLQYRVKALEKENLQLKQVVRKKLGSAARPLLETGNSNPNIITPQNSGGVSSGFGNLVAGGGRTLASPVTLCAFVFGMCLFTQPLQFVATAGATEYDQVLWNSFEKFSDHATNEQLEGTTFGDSGSMFGVLYDGALSWAAATKLAKEEAEKATLMDAKAAGESAVWRMASTHFMLEIIFAAAMAALVFLSYHIVYIWVQECKSSPPDSSTVGARTENSPFVNRQSHGYHAPRRRKSTASPPESPTQPFEV